MNPEYDIAILLATRGRTESLGRCIRSLIELADHPNQLQLMFAFDNDDTIGEKYFHDELQPWLEQREISFFAVKFPRQGYHRLNVYNNKMAEYTNSHWLMIWNDDAVMETQGWDTEIMKRQGEFKLLSVHTHRDHPYSIFPIWPREWYDLFGHCSRHQMIDAELSQIAYMLDLIKIIDINVTHDRPDLTDIEPDATNKERVLFEGNPKNPQDFHNPQVTMRRMQDCDIIAKHLGEKGHDVSFWNNVKAGTQDPWEKLRANDINKQMVQFTLEVK
jgi:hypothetical protein